MGTVIGFPYFSETMEDWDEQQLQIVVDQKHGEKNKSLPPTSIVSSKAVVYVRGPQKFRQKASYLCSIRASLLFWLSTNYSWPQGSYSVWKIWKKRKERKKTKTIEWPKTISTWRLLLLKSVSGQNGNPDSQNQRISKRTKFGATFLFCRSANTSLKLLKIANTAGSGSALEDQSATTGMLYHRVGHGCNSLEGVAIRKSQRLLFIVVFRWFTITMVKIIYSGHAGISVR